MMVCCILRSAHQKVLEHLGTLVCTLALQLKVPRCHCIHLGMEEIRVTNIK